MIHHIFTTSPLREKRGKYFTITQVVKSSSGKTKSLDLTIGGKRVFFKHRFVASIAAWLFVPHPIIDWYRRDDSLFDELDNTWYS